MPKIESVNRINPIGGKKATIRKLSDRPVESNNGQRSVCSQVEGRVPIAVPDLTGQFAEVAGALSPCLMAH